MFNFVLQKIKQRNPILEGKDLLLPQTVLHVNQDNRLTWSELGTQAATILALENEHVNEGSLKTKGIVAKLEYSDCGMDVYFLNFNPHGKRVIWKCTRASDDVPKPSIKKVPDKCSILFQPYYNFVRQTEIRCFSCPTSKGGNHKVQDLYTIRTELNTNGTIAYVCSDDGVREIQSKPLRDSLTRIKKGTIGAMANHNKDWARNLRYSIFRIDMAYDKEGEAGIKGRAYLNEVEIFPCASTFASNTEHGLEQIIHLAACSHLYISSRLQVGGYFCF